MNSIIARLMRGTLSPVYASALDRAISEEAAALNTAACPRPNARREAEDYYAEDIVARLVDPSPLQPLDVLHYRRRATAWAIAEILRGEGITADDLTD